MANWRQQELRTNGGSAVLKKSVLANIDDEFDENNETENNDHVTMDIIKRNKSVQSPAAILLPPAEMGGGGRRGSGFLPPSMSFRARRKLSQPVIASFSAASKFSLTSANTVAMSAKRRLSAVVTGGISWKTLAQSSSSAAANAAIADEARALAARYVAARFRRSGILGHRKLEGLRRMRSVVNLTSANCHVAQSREIFAAIDRLGQTLEARHPKVYASVCRQICRTLTSEQAVVDVLESLARELMFVSSDGRRDSGLIGISTLTTAAASSWTWGRVVALFAIAGALSVDCIIQGHVNYVPAVIETLGNFVERELAPWIIQQGGWYAVVTLVSPPIVCRQTRAIVCGLLGALTLGAIVLLFLLR